MFAKLFGPDDDQILVRMNSNEDENPVIEVAFVYDGSYGAVNLTYEDGSHDENWKKAEYYFQAFDEEKARETKQKIVDCFCEK